MHVDLFELLSGPSMVIPKSKYDSEIDKCTKSPLILILL